MARDDVMQLANIGKKMIKIGVYGSSGKMGQQIISAINRHAGVVLSYEYSRADGDIDELCAYSDVVIDFSSPEGSLHLLPIAIKHNKKVVIGSTGFSEEQKNSLQEASKKIPILYSANTSFLVSLLEHLVSEAASILGSAYDIEILESHHRAKKDAPSGTALHLGATAANARGEGFVPWDHQNGMRPKNAIGFSVIRGGNMCGEHKVMFIGDNESIEISHRSGDRSIYASGAVKCAIWLAGQRQPGLYSAKDVYFPPVKM